MGAQYDGPAGDIKELEARRVSVVALERELIQERIRSGIAAAKARGKRLGRQPGQRPKSDGSRPKWWHSSQRDAAIA